MSQALGDELLTTGYCGHLATVGADGFPHVCPLLYVWPDGQIWLHNTSAQGHLEDIGENRGVGQNEAGKPTTMQAFQERQTSEPTRLKRRRRLSNQRDRAAWLQAQPPLRLQSIAMRNEDAWIVGDPIACWKHLGPANPFRHVSYWLQPVPFQFRS